MIIRICANHGKWPHEWGQLTEADAAELIAHYYDEPCGVPWLAVSAILRAIYWTCGAKAELDEFAFMPLGWPEEKAPDETVSFNDIFNQFRFAGIPIVNAT
jgi:hypothetical protein